MIFDPNTHFSNPNTLDVAPQGIYFQSSNSKKIVFTDFNRATNPNFSQGKAYRSFKVVGDLVLGLNEKSLEFLDIRSGNRTELTLFSNSFSSSEEIKSISTKQGALKIMKVQGNKAYLFAENKYWIIDCKEKRIQQGEIATNSPPLKLRAIAVDAAGNFLLVDSSKNVSLYSPELKSILWKKKFEGEITLCLASEKYFTLASEVNKKNTNFTRSVSRLPLRASSVGWNQWTIKRNPLLLNLFKRLPPTMITPTPPVYQK